MEPRTAHFLSLAPGGRHISARLANAAHSFSRGGILACPKVYAANQARDLEDQGHAKVGVPPSSSTSKQVSSVLNPWVPFFGTGSV